MSAPTPPTKPPSPPLSTSTPPTSHAADDHSGVVKAPDPKLNNIVEPYPDDRRLSIQFSIRSAEAALRTESPKPSRSKPLKSRLSSPPPPSTYESRVSFDTFDNRDATDFSFTLKAKHRHYTYTKRSRTFLCGTDQNDYSEFALEWLLDELVDDGDEVVCLRVVDKDSKINSDSSIEEGRYRKEAYKLMEHIQSKAKDDDKSISLILEFAVGKVQETIQRMISIYEPACLIVGTRGRSLGGIQGLLPGSVSKYCLQNSPVPVIVVRPSSKREKKKRKRRADPARRSYMDILERSEGRGTQVLDKIEQDRLAAGGEATEEEARAVAKAIGLSSVLAEFKGQRRDTENGDEGEGEPLSKVVSTRSDYTSGPESPSPTGELTLEESMVQESSPQPQQLESPEISDEDAKNKSPARDEQGEAPEGRKKMNAISDGEGAGNEPIEKVTGPENVSPSEPV